MNKPVSFKTPSGDDMIILPRSEYEALTEYADMLTDIAAYDAFKEKLANGEEELIPSEFVNRILDGENPIRVWRDLRGLSAKDLAMTCGISAAYLSEIENGHKEGSITVLKKLAEALNVSLEDLV